MQKFQFTGDYESNVTLPDGSVRLTQPGEVVDLDFTEPGPHWVPVVDPKVAAKKAAAAAAEAAVAQAEAAAVAAEAAASTTEETKA